MESSGIRYAVHAYAWTSSWSNADLPILERARSLGLDAVEVPLMELDRVDPAAIRSAADAAGVGLVTSVGLDADHDPSSEDAASRRRAREFLERCVDVTAEMGADLFTGVTYSAMGRRPERRPNDGDRHHAAEVLRDVARFAGERGVTVGIEPVNRYESFLVNTSAQALELRRLVGEPNVGVHLDAYHMNIEEDGFYEPVAAAVDDLVHFHLSESHRGVPGRGTVDWPAIMRALADGGYRGLVGLESFAEVSEAMRSATCIWRDLAPSSDTLVREGLAYLKRLEREERERARPASAGRSA
jgi:D-psicose/D-tagatose/L-ribulose 3-epimerase